MLEKALVNQVTWMICNALPKMHVLAAPKETQQCPCMLLICFKPSYMFCSCFVRFILVGAEASTNHGLSSFLRIFPDIALL